MALFKNVLIETINYPKFRYFELFNFQVTSTCLKKNSLGDSAVRNNPLMMPKTKSASPLGLVFVLSGFAGNGTKYLGDKGFEETFMQQLDRLASTKQLPHACFVFVDAWTFWGGSQFLNSKLMGRYEDFITQELYPALLHHFSIDQKRVAVMGHSSGGYGALHLSSSHPHLFSFCGALSPDCFFEASLLPDLYKAAPFLSKNRSYQKLKALHKDRVLIGQRHGFSIINAIAMVACYSPHAKKKELEWPINLDTGEIRSSSWRALKKYDPVEFLPQRQTSVRKIKGLFLDVGARDEFHLQMGLRQIHLWLKRQKIQHHYSEFDGGHFEAHDRYPLFWEWLRKRWMSH